MMLNVSREKEDGTTYKFTTTLNSFSKVFLLNPKIFVFIL